MRENLVVKANTVIYYCTAYVKSSRDARNGDPWYSTIENINGGAQETEPNVFC